MSAVADDAAVERLACRLHTVMNWSDPPDPPEPWEVLAEWQKERVRYWVRDLLRQIGTRQ